MTTLYSRSIRTAARACGSVCALALFIFLVNNGLSVKAAEANADAKTNAAAVSLATLLDETVDRDALTRFPNYTCKQASSYDRAAKSPSENWFANADTAQFIRVEKNGDREEAVLMEAEGPGAVVRWWITAPRYKTTVRIYIDGAAEPAVVGKIDDVVGGEALVGAPLSAERARGRNLYLPIPYSKSIKITCDNMKEQGNLYYQINYRTYPAGTAVESFSTQVLDAQKDKIEATNDLLLNPGKTTFEMNAETRGFKRYMKSEEMEGLFEAYHVRGPGALTEIDVKLVAEDMVAATRSVILAISFDGEETVWVPVGEFFGSGVGVNPYKSWYTEVCEDGTMKAYWNMPFQKEARVSFVNLGDQDVDVDYAVYYKKRPWTEDSMYFRADWRQERGIKTVAGNGTRDWNYLTVDGKGVYVGDVLSIVNSTPAWWGEGDEKIYVDGEKFPSHFGTGTEDYYGYAWCTPAYFEAPFHAQPRAEGPSNFGNTTNLRFRSLDAIPFAKDFRFDMEIWHWEAATVDYSVATFWYGAPGAALVDGPDRGDMEDEAMEPVEYDREFSFDLNGFKAGEKAATGGRVAVQEMKVFEERKPEFAWQNSKQLWWSQGKVGDKLTIEVADVPAGAKSVTLGTTVANDYCVAQFYWNGARIGDPVDFFIPAGVERRVVKLAIPATKAAATGTLEVEIVGKNAKSIGTMFGVDTIEAK
ncbi:MAG: DUF2961 domain-containing protein [Thermoguttaceae bacterium]|nr:DUF2961 domain-containing protein [Thermoguttaceae bacterium]